MKRLMGAGAAMALACTLLLAAPASADTLGAGCTTTVPDGIERRLEAWAYYTPLGGLNQWYQFDYLLSGHETGNQSNVNIWVMENNSTRWTYHSPDSLGVGNVYTTYASVYTVAATSEWVKFEAIFDRWFASDPKCVGRTQYV
jgi:hypothetical protein